VAERDEKEEEEEEIQEQLTLNDADRALEDMAKLEKENRLSELTVPQMQAFLQGRYHAKPKPKLKADVMAAVRAVIAMKQ
jgi:hypothetical protein